MTSVEAVLLRLYLNSDDRFQHKPLYAAVVAKARSLGLAGASVFNAELGFGSHRVVHDSLSEYAFVGVPVILEIVDAPERIDALLLALTDIVGEGLASVCAVTSVQVFRDEHTEE
jgi:PII-like signaling protein